jgi:dipeptidyl-peptidase-4
MRNAVMLALLLATPAAGAELTLERLFADPALDGPTPRSLRLSPDGTRVTYLQGKETDQFQLDLWELDTGDGSRRLLVDSSRLVDDEGELSQEEKARRERLRIAALRGIVSYDFSRDGKRLLFPIGGDLYLYDLTVPAERAVRRLTRSEAFETDASFSPGGRYVGFVRDGNLHVFDLERNEERALTEGGGDTLSFGTAEFVAQEEMDRYTGYWFADDDSKVAYTRVDESGVAVEQRLEILAGEVRSYGQRYPKAGTANAVVDLRVVDLAGGETREMDLGDDPDVYLARVAWFPDNRHLAVERQSRDQQRLELLRLDASTGEGRVLLTENSDTWVDLHNVLFFLEERDAFVWRSARSGYDHLYLYSNDGTLTRPLTQGPWVVTSLGRESSAVAAVDEAGGWVYFQGTLDSPLERHLYRVKLDGDESGGPQRVTEGAGWHSVTMDRAGRFFLDRFSSPDTPPRVSLRRADGALVAWVEPNALDGSHPYRPYAAGHAVPELGELEAEDGQTLYYALMKPVDFDPARKYPVILRVYGGPQGQEVTREWGSMFDQWLVRRGYLVFRLDNRGTGSRGTRFDVPIYKRMGSVEVRDQARGVEFLRSLAYVDAKRIGVFGWSYGGYMALMCAMQTPELFAAAVSGAPVTDWRLYDTHYTERYMGNPQRDSAAYDAGDVLSHAGGLGTPLLVIHGMADDNVLFQHSTRLFRRLQSDGVAFEMMTYPGAKHGLLREPDPGLHAYRTIAAFFERYLGADDGAGGEAR